MIGFISQINPVNEAAPTWMTPPANTGMSESIGVGGLVFTVVATDADSGVDGTISYSLVSATDSK